MGSTARHRTQAQAASPTTRGERGERRKAAWLVLAVAGAAAGLASLQPQTPALVWNHTESVPIGLYSIESKAPVRGDIVVITPTGTLQATLNAYGVLPAGRLLLKQLAAVSGDTVCRRGVKITINGAAAATARAKTADGRALPEWAGCRTLDADGVVVLTRHEGSFDSRYFGPIGANQIVGVAHPIVTLPSPGLSSWETR